MIKEGVIEKYQLNAIIAQHVYPSMETGNVGVRSGLYMASADEIYITVQGKVAMLPCLMNVLTRY